VQFRDGSLGRVCRGPSISAEFESRMSELEFTTARDEYSTAVSRAVKALKSLGVATALEDSGTGYSSLSYLSISHRHTEDRSGFVRDIDPNIGGNAPLVFVRCHHRHGEEHGWAVAEVSKRSAVAIHQNPRRESGSGRLVLPSVAQSRIWSGWHADWLHAHQSDTASVA